MIERRLYYLQTRLDAAPRGVPSTGAEERHRLLGGRIHRILGGPRRTESAGGVR